MNPVDELNRATAPVWTVRAWQGPGDAFYPFYPREQDDTDEFVGYRWMDLRETGGLVSWIAGMPVLTAERLARRVREIPGFYADVVELPVVAH